MSKRNLYFLIIGIITVTCIIAGSVYHLNKISNYLKDNDEIEYSEEIELNDFNNISIDGKVLKVVIKSGDSFNYEIDCTKERLIPSVSISKNILEIKQDNIGHIHSNNNCKITITIPRDKILGDIDIDVNVGEIEISDISANDVDIENNVGEIKIKDVTFEKLEADSNVGEISLYGVNDLSNYNLSFNSNIGPIKVGNNKFKGSYTNTVNSLKEITLSTNVGNINVY